jgi:2-methylfumaryl-CoA hydratase
VHFNLHEQAQGEFKRRLVYGGVVISLARGAVVQRPRQRLPHRRHQRRAARGALLRRRHGLRLVGGAWRPRRSPAGSDIGASVHALTAVKNRSCADFPLRTAKGEYDDGVILDLDLWARPSALTRTCRPRIQR